MRALVFIQIENTLLLLLFIYFDYIILSYQIEWLYIFLYLGGVAPLVPS